MLKGSRAEQRFESTVGLFLHSLVRIRSWIEQLYETVTDLTR